VLLVLSGLAGASAMILPGVSGGYLLLLLGQYAPILGAIDQLKQGLGGRDLELVIAATWIVVPVGIGVVIGIVGVSNLLRWLMGRYEAATLGALLGLLVGAVVGLYPFQEPVPPEPGFLHRGRVLEAHELAEVEKDDWPDAYFTPSAGQAAGSVGLVLAGLGATLAIARIGGDDDEASAG
jgi:putative membrane protein